MTLVRRIHVDGHGIDFLTKHLVLFFSAALDFSLSVPGT